MIEDNLALLLKYPLISSETRNGVKHYQGVFAIANQDYKLDLIEDKSGEKVHFRLKTQFGDEIDKKIAEINTIEVVDFLDKIKAILESNLPQNWPKTRISVYRKVLCEYSEFCKFHIKIKTSNISEDLSRIHLVTVDEGGREHCLEIVVDFDRIKEIYRPVNLNLPDPFSQQLLKNYSNLEEVYSKFLGSIESLQTFFDSLDDLDKHCSILDPEKPSWKECHRRIWLDQNLSVLVVLDPLKVGVRPDLKFLGPERLILQYREKLHEKLEEWDGNIDLVEGLLSILEIERFPVKPLSNQDMLMDTGECSICFSLRCNNKLPEIICGTKSCENSYHVDCLYEWLNSVNSKRILNQIQGLCPNCEKGISCPLPELNDVTF